MTGISSQQKSTLIPSQGNVWACGDSMTASASNGYATHWPGATALINCAASGASMITEAHGVANIQNLFTYYFSGAGSVSPPYSTMKPIHTIVLAAGTNDIWWGNSTLQQIKDAIASWTQARINDGYRVVHVAEPWWSGGGNSRDLSALNTWLRATYPDTVSVDTVLGCPTGSYNSGDYVHPSTAGYILMAQTIYDAVGP
jgi:lysophospholipase L1-like esterase